MLSVTNSAAELLTEIRQSQALPDHFGVRVYPQEGEAGIEVKLGFAEEPVSSDEVVETEGTKLFIAEELTEPLSESVIDTTDTPEGSALVLRNPD